VQRWQQLGWTQLGVAGAINTNKGIGTKYNGVDILQTHDYIKFYCKSYINKVLLSHGWTKPGPNESNCHDMVPLSPDSVTHLQDLTGPTEGTPEYSKLEKKMKSGYHALLGKLAYSFIIVHVGIGSAIQFLSPKNSAFIVLSLLAYCGQRRPTLVQ